MPDHTHPQTTGGQYLARGDTYDPEDFRMTHRLGVARSLLAAQGIKPEFPKHDPKCICSPEQSFNRCFDHYYSCDAGCTVGHSPRPTWPEWADGEVFDAAYRLANAIQTKRGEHERAAGRKAVRDAKAGVA